MTIRVSKKTLLSGAICLALSGGFAWAQDGTMNAPPATDEATQPGADPGMGGPGAETDTGTPMEPMEPMDQGGGTQSAPPAEDPMAGGMGAAPPQGLVGSTVVDANGEEVGEISELVQQAGSGEYYAVIKGGGFMGIGGDSAVVPVNDLQQQGDQAQLQQPLGEDGLKSLPQYDESQYQPVQTEDGGGMGGGM